jgi:hypothetical protein
VIFQTRAPKYKREKSDCVKPAQTPSENQCDWNFVKLFPMMGIFALLVCTNQKSIWVMVAKQIFGKCKACGDTLKRKSL